jgi:glutamate-1-semialdehyde 2,1-aminomutase
MANGFAASALAGKRELMRYGSRDRDEDDVFLLSGTHSAETVGLSAALATIDVYCREPVIEHLDAQGRRLAAGLTEAAASHGVQDHVFPVGFPCNLVYATLDPDLKPSQSYRSLFLQEVIARGVLMPSLATSYTHTDDDVDRTLEAIDGALGVYARALAAGSTEGLLIGEPSRPVMSRRFR